MNKWKIIMVVMVSAFVDCLADRESVYELDGRFEMEPYYLANDNIAVRIYGESDEVYTHDPYEEIGIDTWWHQGEVVYPSEMMIEGKKYRLTSLYNTNMWMATGLSIPESVSIIHKGCVDSPNLRYINFSEGLKVILDDNCNRMESFKGKLKLPKTLCHIGDDCFNNNVYSEIEFGENLVSIGDNSFNNNENIETLVLPEYLHTIGNNCFNNLKSLKKLVIPRFVDFEGGNCFKGCENIELIEFESVIGNRWVEALGHEYDFDTYFRDTDKEKCVIVVPDGALERSPYYKNAFKNWKHVVEKSQSGIINVDDETPNLNRIRVYTIDGKAVDVKDENLPGGVYITSDGKKSHKILKK